MDCRVPGFPVLLYLQEKRKVSILQRGWEVLVAMYLLQTQDMGSSPHVYSVTSGHCELRH